MTLRANPARRRAIEDGGVARNVLAKNRVKFSQSITPKSDLVDGREHWTLQSQARLEVWAGTPRLKGRWAIELKIVYDTDPGGMAAFVRSGSLGLAWAADDDTTARSFMRYDVDIHQQEAFGEPCHLNVLQPEPFHDRLHLRVPGIEIVEWKLAPTLDFLSSTRLRDELVARFT